MESKLIALVMITLLAGLGGGYGLGYVIYQPQVQNLQKDLGDLNDRFDTLNSTLRDTKTSVTSLQNGLSSTNSKVTSINSTVEEMENRTWHEAYSLEGGTVGAVGEKFQIKGNWIRIRWYMYGPAFISPGAIETVEIPWIKILIKFSNGTSYTDRGSSGVYGSYACDLDTQPGEYFLEVKVYLVDPYLVVVWDYY